MSDEIRLTIPRAKPYFGVAHLVLGGLASRHDLTFETVEDFLLALDDLLARDGSKGDVTLAIRLGEGELETALGPFDGVSLRAELEREPGREVGLRRVLDTLVDGYSIDEREDGHWIQLTKTVGGSGGDGA